MDRLEKWKTIVFLNDFNDWSFNEETNETDVNWAENFRMVDIGINA